MNRLKKSWWLLLLAVATLNLSGCTEVLDRLNMNIISLVRIDQQQYKLTKLNYLQSMTDHTKKS
ncbi:hypothetical protein IGJ34_002414 [Enterococcus sp. AZ177]